MIIGNHLMIWIAKTMNYKCKVQIGLAILATWQKDIITVGNSLHETSFMH